VTDPNQVSAIVAERRPQFVVNAAAYTAVDRAEREPEAAWRVNAAGPETIAAACAAHRVPMIHISTDYVFDGTKAQPYQEHDPVAPLGVYGRTKAEGEERIRSRHEQHVIIRTAWLYGVHGGNFLKTILRLAREESGLRVVADQFGCPTGTADLAEAVLRVADAITAGRSVWGTYHFAGAGGTSWHGFASEIVACQAQFTGRRPAVCAIGTADYPTACRRPPNSQLDSSRFAAVFGYQAMPWRERTAQVVGRLLAAEKDGSGH
jgi:dTDP-4-dehydrorhamnose reductase